MSGLRDLPCPPAFLDPLFNLESCYYYSVPRFYSQTHPNTRWLVTMIRNKEEDRIKRKMEISPETFKNKWFQIVDDPGIYLAHDPTASPMFNRKTILYFSALGLAIYLKSNPIITMLLDFRDCNNNILLSANEPQYASHLQDSNYGDFHSFPPFVIMLRINCFACAHSLISAGWDPAKAVALPMRRRYERRVFYFFDWLEVALGILSLHSLYPLQLLMAQITRDLMLYKPVKLPIECLMPSKDQERVPSGLIDVESLPRDTKMLGVKSLLTITQDYYRYQQMRVRAHEIALVKKEAVAMGVNPEILMMQVQDYDPEADVKSIAVDRVQDNVSNNLAANINVNNSSTKELSVESNDPSFEAIQNLNSIKQQFKQLNTNATTNQNTEEPLYVSEATRILHYALMKDKFGKSLQLCLDSVSVLVRRGFFININELDPSESAMHGRVRDIRNTVVLLLNLAQREQTKVDKIIERIKLGQQKFTHLEEHKLLENRKAAGYQNINKILRIVMIVLVHSKTFPDFIRTNFPPFSKIEINFKFDVNMRERFADIQSRLISEFNNYKNAWTYLTREQMVHLQKNDAVKLSFCVGKKPKKNKGKQQNSSNFYSNSHVTYKKVQRKKKVASGSEIGTLDETNTNNRSNVIKSVELMMSNEAADNNQTSSGDSLQWNQNNSKQKVSAESMVSNLSKDAFESQDAKHSNQPSMCIKKSQDTPLNNPQPHGDQITKASINRTSNSRGNFDAKRKKRRSFFSRVRRLHKNLVGGKMSSESLRDQGFEWDSLVNRGTHQSGAGWISESVSVG